MYPPSRSSSEELNQGMIDGTYRSDPRDRGGLVETATERARKDLFPTWYGMPVGEATTVELPDGRPWHRRVWSGR